MKEIIILFSLIITVFLILKCKNQENFSSVKTLPHNPNISPKDKLDPKYDIKNMKNLYIIDSYHYSQDYSKRIVLKIEDEKATDLKKIFSFRNSKEYYPTDVSKKERNDIIEKGSNLRIDNGIFIYEVPEKKTFKLTPLKYQPLTNKLYNGTKAVEDIKIIQYYNPEDKDNEIKYMIYYQNHLLFVDLVDEKNQIYEMKKLSIEEICGRLGDNLNYIGNEENEIPKDINNARDKDYNRNFNTIPMIQMCPKSHPIACSDDINWRNHCTTLEKGKNSETGICNNFNDNSTFKNKDNLPMRNFKCLGFKCHNLDIGRKQIEEENTKQPEQCFEPTNFITLGKSLEQHKISDIPLTKFLFSINSFMCNIKSKKILDKNGNYIYETGFCHSHIPVETKEISVGPSETEMNFYDTIEVKRNDEECSEGEIEIQKKINENLGFSDKYKLCTINNNSKKEGVTKVKIVNESCNEIHEEEPSNWIEAENTSELIGCYGHNKYFNIDKYKEDKFDPEDNGKDTCKSMAESQDIDYYAYDGKNCYTMNEIPLLPKFYDSSCSNMVEEVTGEIDSLSSIKIYKTKSDNLSKKNIQKNRIYEESYYKIKDIKFGNSYLEYSYDKEKLVGKDVNNLVTDLNTTVRFERVNNIDINYEPLRYNEEIKIKFNEDKKIVLNRIKHTDSVIFSQLDLEGDMKRMYIGIDIDNPRKKDVRFQHTTTTEPMTWGYKLKYFEDTEVKKLESNERNYCKYLLFPYQNLGDKKINWYKDNRAFIGIIVTLVVLTIVAAALTIVTFGTSAMVFFALQSVLLLSVGVTAAVTVSVILTVITVSYGAYYAAEDPDDDKIKPKTNTKRAKWGKDGKCGKSKDTGLFISKIINNFKVLDFNSYTEEENKFTSCKDHAAFPKQFHNYENNTKNKYDFGVDLSILNSLTERKSVSRPSGKYVRYFRGYIPDKNKFNTKNYLLHGNFKDKKYYHIKHRFNNLIKEKNNENSGGYILPSRINVYEKLTNDNYEEKVCLYIEKFNYDDNYPFKMLNSNSDNQIEEEDKEEELTFFILKDNVFESFKEKKKFTLSEELGEYVDLNKNVYLYNDKYSFLLSLNTEDQFKNSYILTNDLLSYNLEKKKIENLEINIIETFCLFKIEMVDKPEGKHDFNELKKVCYKKEPFKVNDIAKAKYQTYPCDEFSQINMSESSDFHLCINKEDMSEKRNHHFKEQNPTDSNGYIPFPLK